MVNGSYEVKGANKKVPQERRRVRERQGAVISADNDVCAAEREREPTACKRFSRTYIRALFRYARAQAHYTVAEQATALFRRKNPMGNLLFTGRAG